LVEWAAASGRNLTTIYITHGHGDHFFGTGALLNHFPNASTTRKFPLIVKHFTLKKSNLPLDADCAS
jgi:glyoxylase-like metal-dependent hydrolase (beta-lactamase superfamily II)